MLKILTGCYDESQFYTVFLSVIVLIAIILSPFVRNAERHYSECLNSECYCLDVVMMSAFVVHDIMLSVIILSVMLICVTLFSVILMIMSLCHSA